VSREKGIAVGVTLGLTYIGTLLLAAPRKRPAAGFVLGSWGSFGRARRKVRRRVGVGDPAVLKRARKMIKDLSQTFGVRRPVVTFGLTSRNASYRYSKKTGRADIRLREGAPWTEPLEYAVLHEFAHHVVRERFRHSAHHPKPHGNEFLDALCRVLREYGKPFTGPVNEYGTVKACVLRSAAAPLVRESYAQKCYAKDAREEAVVHAVAELQKRTKGGLTLPSDAKTPLPKPHEDFRKKKIPRIMKLRRFQVWENSHVTRYPNWTLAYFLERKKKKDPMTGTWMSWYNVVLPDGTVHATQKHQIIGVAR